MIKFSVVGASGYVGGELLRLAANHPQLELHLAVAHSNAGEPVAGIHPHLRHLSSVRFDSLDMSALRQSDVVFLALPHGKSGELALELSNDQLVIDAGADFRLLDAGDWVGYYGTPHLGSWPYGLPELTLASGAKQRVSLLGTKRVATPGCNVSAVTIALAPGYSANAFQSHSSAVLAVGTSGAGRSLRTDLLASEVMGSARAYGVAGAHRHNPEILQNLRLAGAKNPTTSFTPILVPMTRGILAVANVALAPTVTELQLRETYQDAYGDETFIQLLPSGVQPATASVLGSNYAQIGIEVEAASGIATITVAIDNLVKGTAGAAIQSMNLALGIPESTGLTQLGVAP